MSEQRQVVDASMTIMANHSRGRIELHIATGGQPEPLICVLSSEEAVALQQALSTCVKRLQKRGGR